MAKQKRSMDGGYRSDNRRRHLRFYHILCVVHFCHLLLSPLSSGHPAGQHLLKKPDTLLGEIEECRKEGRYYTLPVCADHPQGKNRPLFTKISLYHKERSKHSYAPL